MGKGFLNQLDVCVGAKELNERVAGCRLANVYDLGPRTYLFKFARPGIKLFVLVEQGARFHITTFERDTGPTPNPFATKLRKHLRTRRIEGVRQLGFDRSMQFSFGQGENVYHLFFEFFAGGNIILCNHEYCILALLRPYDTVLGKTVAMRQIYPWQDAKAVPEDVTVERVEEAISNHSTLVQTGIALNFPKFLIVHCLAELGIAANTKSSSELTSKLFEALHNVYLIIHKSMATSITPAFLIRNSAHTEFNEFSPLIMKEHDHKIIQEFPSLNSAMDTFYGKLESDKNITVAKKVEREVLSKEERLRRDFEQRKAKLLKAYGNNSHIAMLIETHHEMVDAAIAAVQAEIAGGIDWNDLKRALDAEKKKDNSIAAMIKTLHLQRNAIELSLPDSQDDKVYAVEIDLGLSAHCNAGVFYERAKKSRTKHERTDAAASSTLMAAKKRGDSEMRTKAKQAKGVLNVRRKVHWFEKFHWFITSDNLLVIAGRDMQQNDILVRKYLDTKDYYFHADIHGASSVILKNPSGLEVPPRSLEQAGCLAVCRSNAWTHRTITAAYWVFSDQVSKTAPSGQFVTTGSFVIRGKRNYLPPSPLIMGFGIMFRLEDNSIARHSNDRKASTSSCADTVTIDPEVIRRRALSIEESEQPLQALNETNTHSALVLDEDMNDDIEFDVTSKLVISANASHAAALATHDNDDSDSHEEKHDSATEHCDDCNSSVNSDDDNIGDDVIHTNLFKNRFADERISTSPIRTRPRLSHKQRRNLKKTGDPNIAPQASENDAKRCGSPKSKGAVPLVLPRGKRNKIKRIQAKYRNQDFEERSIRAELLGTTLPSGDVSTDIATSFDAKIQSSDINGEDEEHSDDDDDDEQSNRNQAKDDSMKTTSQDWIVKRCFKCMEIGHVIRDCPRLQGVDKSELNKAVRSGQDQRRQELTEDTVVVGDDGDDLNALTGRPVREDELIYAVPVCAPFSALADCMLKVKLLPGPVKRGTAVKSSMSVFNRLADGDRRIHELLSGLHDNELTSIFIGGVKVSVPGLASKKPGGKSRKHNRGSKKRLLRAS